ncbi:MAG: hypothetical protein ACI9R3_003324, partial [Verrucomicrobiales bacterium]
SWGNGQGKLHYCGRMPCSMGIPMKAAHLARFVLFFSLLWLL